MTDDLVRHLKAELLARERAYEILEGQLARTEAETVKIRHALTESVKLQAHYGELLNMHDGGQRMIFQTVEAWLARLASMKG